MVNLGSTGRYRGKKLMPSVLGRLPLEASGLSPWRLLEMVLNMPQKCPAKAGGSSGTDTPTPYWPWLGAVSRGHNSSVAGPSLVHAKRSLQVRAIDTHRKTLLAFTWIKNIETLGRYSFVQFGAQ